MRIRWLLPMTLAFGLFGCEDDVPVTTQRGMDGVPGAKPSSTEQGPAKRGGGSAQPPTTVPSGAASEVEDVPPRPSPTLDAKSFARVRDPFQSAQMDSLVVPEVERPKAQRKVRMPQYRFEDLKLIAIVNSGRGVVPRALFLASDGKSGTIHQGEYFSSAEVLLAAVNRDYVEIEIVDDVVASGLNLERGERRAIYLRND